MIIKDNFPPFFLLCPLGRLAVWKLFRECSSFMMIVGPVVLGGRGLDNVHMHNVSFGY